MMRTLCLSACALFAFACSSDSGPTTVRDDIPDPPPGGVQIVSQEFTVPAGKETFMCMKVPFEVSKTMYVQGSHVYQAESGHHTVVFYSAGDTAGVDPNPHPCDGFEMTNVRIITTGAADGAGLEMPEGVALSVPEGAQVWIQSHYINTTSEDLTAQDVINLELIPEDQVTQVASTFAHLDLTFSLPPHQESSTTIECQIPQDMTVPWLLPHMHEWGKHFALEIDRDGVTDPLFKYEGDWFESARDDFPIQDLDQPLELHKGDRIRTTCDWQNTEDEALIWPREMCVTFFPFYPGDGSLVACDENGEVFSP